MFRASLMNVHYNQLLSSADTVLQGPSSVSMGTEFWGEPNLALYVQAMPRIEGTIESRTMYANPTDADQNRAILRQAAWDARTTRQSVIQKFRQGREPSIYPILLVRYVWIDIGWLYNATQRLEELVVPLRVSKMSPIFRTMYRVRMHRIDRTIADISWGKGMPGEFQILSIVWESLWQEMDHLLQTSEMVEPEESWGYDFRSVLAYKTSEAPS